MTELDLSWCSFYTYRNTESGVPAMAQWVKNPTVEAQMAVEVRVQFPAWHSGLKDLALPQLQCSSHLKLRFNP